MVNKGWNLQLKKGVDDMYRLCTGAGLFLSVGIRRNEYIGTTFAFYGFHFSLAFWTGLEHSRAGTFEFLVVHSTEVDTPDDTLPPA